jgi:hypothetical protein
VSCENFSVNSASGSDPGEYDGRGVALGAVIIRCGDN